MYLHAGNNRIIRKKDIIGIFDLDNATVSAITKKFLITAERDGRLESINEEIPKSFLLFSEKNNKNAKICISQISSLALLSRIRKTKGIK